MKGIQVLQHSFRQSKPEAWTKLKVRGNQCCLLLKGRIKDSGWGWGDGSTGEEQTLHKQDRLSLNSQHPHEKHT